MRENAPFSLEGQVALITGGGTGLGLGMAQCLTAAGAKVVLVGRREEPLKQACATMPDQAAYVVQDITDRAAADDLAARAAGHFGPISILINNAGIHLKKFARDTTAEEFDRVLQTHVVAAFNLTRAILPQMIEQKRGHILFTASMTSLMGMPQVVAYSAAKSAYVGMVRSLATELAEHNIRVNAIAPGWIQSDMLEKALSGDPVRKQKILGRTPMNRFGEPRDIGWAAVYLSSPAAQFVTGVLLPIDGGANIGF